MSADPQPDDISITCSGMRSKFLQVRMVVGQHSVEHLVSTALIRHVEDSAHFLRNVLLTMKMDILNLLTPRDAHRATDIDRQLDSMILSDYVEHICQRIQIPSSCDTTVDAVQHHTTELTAAELPDHHHGWTYLVGQMSIDESRRENKRESRFDALRQDGKTLGEINQILKDEGYSEVSGEGLMPCPTKNHELVRDAKSIRRKAYGKLHSTHNPQEESHDRLQQIPARRSPTTTGQAQGLSTLSRAH